MAAGKPFAVSSEVNKVCETIGLAIDMMVKMGEFLKRDAAVALIVLAQDFASEVGISEEQMAAMTKAIWEQWKKERS